MRQPMIPEHFRKKVISLYWEYSQSDCSDESLIRQVSNATATSPNIIEDILKPEIRRAQQARYHEAKKERERNQEQIAAENPQSMIGLKCGECGDIISVPLTKLDQASKEDCERCGEEAGNGLWITLGHITPYRG